MARALQRQGHSVGLLDLDIFGPSLPTLLRMHYPEVGMHGEQLLPVDSDGLKTMSMGYLLGDRPAVMRGPMVSNYCLQILHNTAWGKLDYLLIDLPPGTGDIQLTLVQQAALDGAIIVTTPQALSLVDVARGILMFEKVEVPVLGVVENMAYYTCDQCGKKHFPFGESTQTLQERFGLPSLAQLPILPGISEAAGRHAGKDIQAFDELANQLHRAIGMRRLGDTDKPVAKVEPGTLHIVWPGGEESRIPNKTLRVSCHCAMCVDEYDGTALLDPDTIPEDIHIEEISPLGNYALSITWSDGHSSGIYSWDHLRNVANA